jgi:APA family basic amino acid/polyamine antiporter
VALVAVGTAGAEALSATAAPLRAAAGQTAFVWLPVVVSAGGLTAMLGVILSQLLGLSRMVFAMARRGDLPRSLEYVDAGRAVPGRAVLAVGAIAAVVAATGSLRGIAAAASFTILVYYGITNLAALRMPPETKRYSDAVPLVGLTSCVLLAVSLPPATIGAGLTILAAGVIARWASRPQRS